MDSRWSFVAGTACGVASVYLAQEGVKAVQERRRIAAIAAAEKPVEKNVEVPKTAKDGLAEPPPEHCPGVESDKAGKSDACAGCPNKSICASGAPKKDPAVSLIAERLQNVKNKVLVLSGKGGVGKSTVSAQLAFAFSRLSDVGLLDIDICGPSAPRMLGLDGHEVHQSADGWTPVYVSDSLAVMSIGFMLPNKDDAIIWRGPKKNGLIKQFLTDVMWGPLDMLLVDTPPGTSDEHLSIVTYLGEVNVDGAIIVTTPQEVSLQDVRKEINFCKKVGVPIIGVIENMSGFICPGCNSTTDILRPSTGGAQQMCKDMDVHYLGAIPMDQDVVMAGESGKPLGDISKNPALLDRLTSLVSNINSRISEMKA